ncbi:MAG: sigma 54-dependent Fis family transcriptional regulator [Sandaracinus sp.]|nr:sigma 54-dependent Fis family transcriptional regulator [Sandaracinus sp.]
MATVATAHGEALPKGKREAAQLVVVDGPDMGRAVRLDAEPVLVGASRECALVLSDERVSRRHCSVEVREGVFRVVDLGSRNGTLFEGSALTEATVPLGATIQCGRSFLRILPRNAELEVRPSASRRFGELVGESLAMREVFAVLELAAASEVTVLLEGETGTGKELAARALHAEGPRRSGPFVAIDCGALPENLVESELFGHVKGAFTGAQSDRAGAFRRARGGTLFLDELDGVPLDVQARLLRAIEERRVRPVGGEEEVGVDVRLVCGARADLSKRVADGAFRPDLYYRISVLRVSLPPLRARREDVAPIAAALLRARGLEPGPIAGPSFDRLFAHDWPGNVRELRNVLDRALALRPDATSFADLRVRVGEARDDGDPLAVRVDLPFGDAKQRVVDAFERRYLDELVTRHEGNLSAAARDAGLDRKHLRQLLEKHGLR